MIFNIIKKMLSGYVRDMIFTSFAQTLLKRSLQRAARYDELYANNTEDDVINEGYITGTDYSGYKENKNISMRIVITISILILLLILSLFIRTFLFSSDQKYIINTIGDYSHAFILLLFISIANCLQNLSLQKCFGTKEIDVTTTGIATAILLGFSLNSFIPKYIYDAHFLFRFAIPMLLGLIAVTINFFSFIKSRSYTYLTGIILILVSISIIFFLYYGDYNPLGDFGKLYPDTKILGFIFLILFLFIIVNFKLDILSLGREPARSVGLAYDAALVSFLCLSVFMTALSVYYGSIYLFLGVVVSDIVVRITNNRAIYNIILGIPIYFVYIFISYCLSSLLSDYLHFNSYILYIVMTFLLISPYLIFSLIFNKSVSNL